MKLSKIFSSGNLRRAAAIAALALPMALAGQTGTAMAQAWPSKPVRIIVPFGAGTTDVLARLFGKALSETTGQSFIVENKTGAGGSIGSLEVARAAPDGHTLLLATSSTHSVAPNFGNLPYDTAKDFTPIAHLGASELLILLDPNFPVTTLSEVLKMAKDKPGTISFASNGAGTIGHLAFELLSIEAGISMIHVPYKGSGLSIPDVSSGRVTMTTDVPATGAGHISAGRVKGLAVTGPKRAATLPNVPAVAETIPGFSAMTWWGLYGPKGLSPEATRQIHAAFMKAMQSPELAERYRALGVDPGRGTPEEFAAMVVEDSARWGKVIKERNIKVE
jgi:tripartite-type tricarboxylate transporter receptor subunit TctC